MPPFSGLLGPSFNTGAGLLGPDPSWRGGLLDGWMPPDPYPALLPPPPSRLVRMDDLLDLTTNPSPNTRGDVDVTILPDPRGNIPGTDIPDLGRPEQATQNRDLNRGELDAEQGIWLWKPDPNLDRPMELDDLPSIPDSLFFGLPRYIGI